MHEQKGIVIAAAIAALGFTNSTLAQMDAAEKAQEGGIDHWIEYYKGEQRKPAVPTPQSPASPADRPAPVERTESNASPQEKTN